MSMKPRRMIVPTRPLAICWMTRPFGQEVVSRLRGNLEAGGDFRRRPTDDTITGHERLGLPREGCHSAYPLGPSKLNVAGSRPVSRSDADSPTVVHTLSQLRGDLATVCAGSGRGTTLTVTPAKQVRHPIVTTR